MLRNRICQNSDMGFEFRVGEARFEALFPDGAVIHREFIDA